MEMGSGIQLEGVGSVVSSPSEIRDGTRAENGFSII